MSLVNDVLRQLDSDTSKPYPNMPLQSAGQSKTAINWSRFLFVVLVVALLVILSLQMIFKESIIEIFMDNKPAEAPTLLLPPEIKQPLTEDKPLTEEKRLIAAAPQITEQKIAQKEIAQQKIAPKQPLPKVTRAKTQESGVAKQEIVTEPKLQPEPQSKTQSKTQSQPQPINIKVVENPGFKQYQLALQAYKKKQYSAAAAWIDAAIVADDKDEYLRLKARILIQQGKGEELRDFVVSQNNNSLAWFQLVAPGLQMFAHYELSNQYYAELTQQQPNQVKWQLAMALNFAKLGYSDKTQSIYENLLNSSLPTSSQKQWIATRLQRMERAGSNRNDS